MKKTKKCDHSNHLSLYTSTFVDVSGHFSLGILLCPFCKQKFLELFVEFYMYGDGDDMYILWLPVSEEEIDPVFEDVNVAKEYFSTRPYFYLVPEGEVTWETSPSFVLRSADVESNWFLANEVLRKSQEKKCNINEINR